MTSETHSHRAHARLAPSAAHRWISCPGSIRLSDGIPNTTSSFAAEGTAAHELASHCLETGADPADFIDMWIDTDPPHPQKWIRTMAPESGEGVTVFRVDEEMADAVEMYCGHVRGLRGADDLLDVEQRLDMTHLHPEIFGTGDATVFRVADRHLHVVDLKYGKGVAVDADENPQLLLYAAGAARRHHNQQIAKLTVHIVQPRAQHAHGPVRSYDIDLLGLFEFEDTLQAAAKATEAEDAALRAGDWCRFCPALAICPAARESAVRAAAEEFGEIGDDMAFTPPEKLAPEKLGVILKEAEQIGNYVKAVQEHAHAQAEAGNLPSGYKLVAKRAIRKWKNEDDTRQHLYDLGATNDDILTEPKLKSPAQVEKLFPGKNKDERQKAMADLVKKESSGTNLVPQADARPAVHVGPGADFEAVDVG